MTKRAWMLALTLVLTGCAGPRLQGRPTPAPDAPPGAQVKVATYNLNFGMAGDAPTLEAIAATAADIIALQETSARWQVAIDTHPLLRERYPHRLFFHSERYPAGGMAFLSRYPLTEHQRRPSPAGFFDAHRLIARLPSGPLQLLNVHLKPPVSRSGSVVVGYFSTPKERRLEMAHFKRLLDAELPTVILGDFNEQRGGGLQVAAREGYRDVFRAAGITSGRATWRWRVGPLKLRSQLDHILYDPRHFRVVGARILKLGRSDHLPVVATLERRRTTRGRSPTPTPAR